MKTAKEKLSFGQFLKKKIGHDNYMNKYPQHYTELEISLFVDEYVKSLIPPTVTDEEIERMADEYAYSEENDKWQESDNIESQIDAFEQGFKAAQSRLSQPVNKLNLEDLARKFTEKIESVTKEDFEKWNEMDENRGQSQPVREYCECKFSMIRRDENTQTPYCFECKKEINETQPVTGYSEEGLNNAIRVSKVLDWNKPSDESIQSLKSKPTTNTEE